MLTFGAYVRDVLLQVRASYAALDGLEDRPGDLVVLKREWLKADGLLRSLARRIADSGGTDDAYCDLARRCSQYVESYDFGREMDIMSGLYSDDPHRLKNMRLKMLESFREGRFIDVIDGMIERLDGE